MIILCHNSILPDRHPQQDELPDRIVEPVDGRKWFSRLYSDEDDAINPTAKAFNRIMSSSVNDLWIGRSLGDLSGNYNPFANLSFLSSAKDAAEAVFTGDTKAMNRFIKSNGVWRSITAFIPPE